jgi:hypothetical protein
MTITCKWAIYVPARLELTLCRSEKTDNTELDPPEIDLTAELV